MKETIKQGGYVYIRYMGNGQHLLENIKGVNPYQFEVWLANKNHASYGLIYKNTHLEFARTGIIQGFTMLVRSLVGIDKPLGLGKQVIILLAQTYFEMDNKSEAINTKQAQKAKKFVLDLVAEGINLADININDFASSYPYRVYVGNRYSKNGLRVYTRFSKRDVENCVKWFSNRFPTMLGNWQI